MIPSIVKISIQGNKDEDVPNQDFIDVFENESFLIATISDGLGSSKKSSEGARIACKIVIDEIQNFQISSDLQILNTRIKTLWEKAIYQIADSFDDYRTTSSFVAIFKKQKKIITGRFGDVLISLRIDGFFQHLKTTEKDFSNETECLGSKNKENYFLSIHDFQHSFDFLIATDGIADELQPEKINSFHDYLKNRFQSIKYNLREQILKNDIENFINKKNNDDKSLIYAWTQE